MTRTIEQIYEELRQALQELLRKNDFADKKINIKCDTLTAQQAIGTPEHQDYPIVKGKERMVEASIEGAKGQAFTDEFSQAELTVRDLLTMDLSSNQSRARFIAAFNALYRYAGLVDKTVHCKNEDLLLCARELANFLPAEDKVLLIGLQPRFLETLSARQPVRVVDLDEDNIGEERYGITIEPEENTDDAIQWCDTIFATGSTIVNGSITRFLAAGKRVIFFGVTIAAPAKVLGLEVYCTQAG